jgi:putative heme iron utilization protein
MATEPKVIRDTDDAARAQARQLIASADTAALAVLDPATGAPYVSRIAVAQMPDLRIVTLVSDLALHTGALRADPRASLLLGSLPAKGDPLAHPRLTLSVAAQFVPRGAPDHADIRAHWLTHHPKSALYADFGDFGFVVFTPLRAWLNGGFGKAYELMPEDLRLARE